MLAARPDFRFARKVWNVAIGEWRVEHGDAEATGAFESEVNLLTLTNTFAISGELTAPDGYVLILVDDGADGVEASTTRTTADFYRTGSARMTPNLENVTSIGGINRFSVRVENTAAGTHGASYRFPDPLVAALARG